MVTFNAKKAPKRLLAQLREENEGIDYIRPKKRAACLGEDRPCPYLACRHHLAFDVNNNTGSIKENFPGVELEDMKETCSLDVADSGWRSHDEVGELMGICRQRVQQIEAKALRAVQRAVPRFAALKEHMAERAPLLRLVDGNGRRSWERNGETEKTLARNARKASLPDVLDDGEVP